MPLNKKMPVRARKWLCQYSADRAHMGSRLGFPSAHGKNQVQGYMLVSPELGVQRQKDSWSLPASWSFQSVSFRFTERHCFKSVGWAVTEEGTQCQRLGFTYPYLGKHTCTHRPTHACNSHMQSMHTQSYL